MDGISLTASIIAVLQLTTSVAKQAYKYGKSVKNASEDMGKISNQLKDVEAILVKLKALADREIVAGNVLESWPTLVSLNSPNGALERCRHTMEALCAELITAEGLKKYKQRVRWPSTKNKIERYLGDIRTQKDVFITLLNIEHMGQSLETAHAVSHISSVQRDDKRQEIIQWSSYVDPNTNHQDARKEHEDQTGKWFTEGNDYLRWRGEPNSFLWLYGIPGCGKTILCSGIIEQTRLYCAAQPADRVLAFFYFSFRDKEKQKVTNLLRSILSQLVRQAESISDLVHTLHNDYPDSQPPTDRLIAAIKSMLDRSKEFFIIIDALDECPDTNGERNDLCNVLGEIKDWLASNLHVLITGRREADLIASLDPLCTVDPISIQGPTVQSDIRKFIRSQLWNDRKLREWSTDIKEEIETTLVQGANGMFRWVGCQLASLKKCIAPEDVKNTLRSLPQTLDDTYKRILMDIDERHQRKILVALQWICHACEPVTIEELAEAVIIDPTGAVSFSPRNRIPDPHWLLEILSGLVTISEDCRNLNTMDIGKSVQVVELAHFSVKEYLTSSLILLGPAQKFYIQEESAIEDVLQRSLLYLMSYSVSDMKSASTQDLAEFPLLLYASHYWHHHLLAAEDTISSEMKDLVFDFLNTKTTLLSWLSIYRPDNPFEECFSAESFEIGEPLYYVALWGSCTMVRHIIKWGTSVDAKGREYGSALGAAASNGHTSTVKLLLEAGAKINTYGEEDGFLLETAVAAGDPDHIKFLLEAGADVNAQGGEYGTALHAFSNFGNTEIVAMLLEAGADVNADVEPYGTPIEAALDHDADEHMGVIDLLVAAGADINALDEDELDMLRWYRDSGSK